MKEEGSMKEGRKEEMKEGRIVRRPTWTFEGRKEGRKDGR